MASMSKNVWDPDNTVEFKLFDEVIISEIGSGYKDQLSGISAKVNVPVTPTPQSQYTLRPLPSIIQSIFHP
jgi:hypothetical protein